MTGGSERTEGKKRGGRNLLSRSDQMQLDCSKFSYLQRWRELPW
jgi:hypothetical protein